jgi:Coenzyme PQQ synthesis protein D (PqqD)
MKQTNGFRSFLGLFTGSADQFRPSLIKPEEDPASIAVAPDARVALHDGGIAFLNIATGKLFLSNETGSEIWRGLVAGMSLDAIARKISSECGVGWDLVWRHMSSFIAELESRGLIIRKVESRA